MSLFKGKSGKEKGLGKENIPGPRPVLEVVVEATAPETDTSPTPSVPRDEDEELFVNIFSVLGFPRDPSKALSPQAIEQAMTAFAERDPAAAYWSGRQYGHDRLVELSRAAYLENEPLTSAWWIGKVNGDKDLVSLASQKLLQYKPGLAYQGARFCEDTDLANQAREAFVHNDPLVACMVSFITRDGDLFHIAGSAILEKEDRKSHLEMIYNGGKSLSDNELQDRATALLLGQEEGNSEGMLQSAAYALLEGKDDQRIRARIAYQLGRVTNNCELQRRAAEQLIDSGEETRVVKRLHLMYT